MSKMDWFLRIAFALFFLSLVALGAANVTVVYYCQRTGGHAMTPFLTTICLP